MDKQYKLNPYSLIHKNKKGEFVFYKSPDSTYTSTKLTLFLNEEQQKILGVLLKDDYVDLSDLKRCFKEEDLQFLVKNKILTTEYISTNGIYDRSVAFYKNFLNSDCQKILNSKEILILGCGGLGSHLAWYMAVHGIGKITLVDFDKVEESNLNRQILYTQEDLGKEKVFALKEHIENINPYIEIEAINKKVASFFDLQKVCKRKKYNLIVKALDSPNEMPIWIDKICKEEKIPYVSGITLRDKAFIGPTYIPNLSKYGWSDIIQFNKDELENKIYGTIPSVGIILAHIACEMAQEAIKILLKYDNYKYIDVIVTENIFDNKKDILTVSKKLVPDMYRKQDTFFYNLISIILAICLGAYNQLFLILSALFVIFLPLKDFSDKKLVLKGTFVNNVIFIIGTMVMLCVSNFRNSDEIGRAFILLNSFIILSIFSLITCTISYLICEIRER